MLGTDQRVTTGHGQASERGIRVYPFHLRGSVSGAKVWADRYKIVMIWLDPTIAKDTAITGKPRHSSLSRRGDPRLKAYRLHTSPERIFLATACMI
jgi:hypothetical protein